MTDSSLRDATSFKVDFDSFFSLYKKFYIKVVKGTQVLDDAIETELEAKFEADAADKKAEQNVKTAITNFISDSFKPLIGTIGENITTISNYLDKIDKKIKKISDLKSDSNLTKYAKFDIIDESLEFVETLVDGQIIIPNYDIRKNKILDKLAEARETRKALVINEYKHNTDTRNKLDNNMTLRLATYEGTASNVLRDLLTVSNNLVGDINTKRLNLQNGFINDESLGKSVVKDFDKIGDYHTELVDTSEIKKNCRETYRKVAQNLVKIEVLVGEIKSGLGIE